ncbi:hypothetical protein HHI36_000227 [Cryptolaemus montrouzieri]|uniref:Uncharacterized protein n=1 Tax=Cryptolaemus montrouzieri TaxID=559131 RepID=A0ABD2P4H3_9CUCU
MRQGFRLRRENVLEIPLVPIKKVLLPPLHIKLEIVKNFIKALDPEGNAFNELKRIFPRLSEMKIKEGLCETIYVPINLTYSIFNTYFFESFYYRHTQ